MGPGKRSLVDARKWCCCSRDKALHGPCFNRLHSTGGSIKIVGRVYHGLLSYVISLSESNRAGVVVDVRDPLQRCPIGSGVGALVPVGILSDSLCEAVILSRT